MTLRTKIDQFIKFVDLLRTEAQNINSKLDSVESRLAKLKNKIKKQQGKFFFNYSKKLILKKLVY